MPSTPTPSVRESHPVGNATDFPAPLFADFSDKAYRNSRQEFRLQIIVILPVWNLTIPQRICIFSSRHIAVSYCIYFITFPRFCQYPTRNWLCFLLRLPTLRCCGVAVFRSLHFLVNQRDIGIVYPEKLYFPCSFFIINLCFLIFSTLLLLGYICRRSKPYVRDTKASNISAQNSAYQCNTPTTVQVNTELYDYSANRHASTKEQIGTQSSAMRSNTQSSVA